MRKHEKFFCVTLHFFSLTQGSRSAGSSKVAGYKKKFLESTQQWHAPFGRMPTYTTAPCPRRGHGAPLPQRLRPRRGRRRSHTLPSLSAPPPPKGAEAAFFKPCTLSWIIPRRSHQINRSNSSHASRAWRNRHQRRASFRVPTLVSRHINCSNGNDKRR